MQENFQNTHVNYSLQGPGAAQLGLGFRVWGLGFPQIRGTHYNGKSNGKENEK